MSPRMAYIVRNFSDDSLAVIDHANGICQTYQQQGYDLTLRQLFYQFVSRDLMPNTERSYKRLGSIVNDARLAGLLDWHFIVDRTRNVRSPSHWTDPAEIIESAAQSFALDKWADQENYVEVWIEKDALVGVLQSCCPDEDVPYFSCRGYTSQSEVWSAAQRLAKRVQGGQRAVIVHLGDHDPSGIDMTRDIEDRLAMFMEPYEVTVERIALNNDQVEQYDPPPNPAKLSDSRAAGYIQRFGRSSWELDALEPTVLVGLIRAAVNRHRDADLWQEKVDEQEAEREVLNAASERWGEVKEFLS